MRSFNMESLNYSDPMDGVANETVPEERNNVPHETSKKKTTSKKAQRPVVLVDGVPRKRGRPRGSKNMPKEVIPTPQGRSTTIESSGPTLKMKKVHKTDSRMTLMQMHEERLSHVKCSADMDESDIDYMITAIKYLTAHTDENTKKASLLNEYVHECYKTDYDGLHNNVHELYEKANTNKNVASAKNETVCVCGSDSFVIDTSTATRVCTDCGASTHYQDSSISDLWSDERVQVLSKVAYKRVNHMREILNSIQARQQCTPGLGDVISKVKQELKKERITDMTHITPGRIREYLHNLRLGKYYEYASSIYFEVTKKKIPKFSLELEHALMSMFVSIQPVFDSLPDKSRKNFLSYSFVLNKFSSILGEAHLLEFFPLLKSREKLYLQDKIWKKICVQMKWEFKPSI